MNVFVARDGGQKAALESMTLPSGARYIRCFLAEVDKVSLADSFPRCVFVKSLDIGNASDRPGDRAHSGRRPMWAGLEADGRAFRQVMEPDLPNVAPPKRVALAVVPQQRPDAAVLVEVGNDAGHNR
jgi:hypothetical protein